MAEVDCRARLTRESAEAVIAFCIVCKCVCAEFAHPFVHVSGIFWGRSWEVVVMS